MSAEFPQAFIDANERFSEGLWHNFMRPLSQYQLRMRLECLKNYDRYPTTAEASQCVEQSAVELAQRAQVVVRFSQTMQREISRCFQQGGTSGRDACLLDLVPLFDDAMDTFESSLADLN
ncbi:hypothetical protein H696_02558 [Fonticula alba]|uniref:Uncharacterized protein n=1 Tax=Fonticula alba TaxID=691883 RepID=A0A058Z8H6_FONAL|nr:hypothetical protein H696_02558 [Fonticula alba]KCV70228.1 hypothetical protein H696_02558 [Fonticula alba]|eukprot:XP_009494744.1 hypothetical protein H696_02558 [Fonticula alba]